MNNVLVIQKVNDDLYVGEVNPLRYADGEADAKEWQLSEESVVDDLVTSLELSEGVSFVKKRRPTQHPPR